MHQCLKAPALRRSSGCAPMLSGAAIVTVSFLYLGLLFAIAYYCDKRADAGRSLIANPYVYAMSIGVYCTSWTFFGSVGRATASGVGFLPIYLGPTLTFILGWIVIRKIIRISKANRITSIADFIASRYGKSFELGILVSVIAVIGIPPYISLQLKAVSASFAILQSYPAIAMPTGESGVSFLHDTELYVALLMALFAILFGTRHIDVSEHHEGMVAAVAFESVVKLVAFLAVGLFVTFGVFGGFADIFAKAEAVPELQRLFTIGGVPEHTSWITLTLLAMVASGGAAAPVPGDCGRERRRAPSEAGDLAVSALFAGDQRVRAADRLRWPAAVPGGEVKPDTFVLTIAMKEQQPLLALLAFIGGLSAATGMIIMETVALATMVSNDLVMPLLLRIGRLHLQRAQESDRRAAGDPPRHDRARAAARLPLRQHARDVLRAGHHRACLVRGGAAVRAGHRRRHLLERGDQGGRARRPTGGFLVWTYTLLLPSFSRSGWLRASFVDHGPWGIALLKPYALLGLDGLDPIAHATIWTLLCNIVPLVAVSLVTSQSMLERNQANQFVDVFQQAQGVGRVWRGRANVGELWSLLDRFLGTPRADAVLARFERDAQRTLNRQSAADQEVVAFVERQLAGTIGAASARIMVASVLREEMHDIDEVSRILDEATQLVIYARRLEDKSRELEAASAELTTANVRLKELDKLKDDFMATVSHEIRTPLTSIRSFSEILRDNPDLDLEQRQEFVTIIVQESERLSRLINDILDLAKMEAGTTQWSVEDVAPATVIEQALAATSGLFAARPGSVLEADIAR